MSETEMLWSAVQASDTALKDARSVARRLLRERDEARDRENTLKSIYEYEMEILSDYYVKVNHLESDRDALAKQCDELRKALEQVEWVFVYGYGHICPWCKTVHENLDSLHTPNCPRQKALRKA